MLDAVSDFQSKFGQGYVGPIRELPASVAALRKKLVLEESQELIDAVDRGELEEQLDANADLLYVILGNVVQLGMTDVFIEAFWRVHTANMQKALVKSRHGSKRDSPRDIVKPEGWVKPDMTDLVRSPDMPFTNRDPRGGEG